MLRALWLLTGLSVAAVLVLSVLAEPHLWSQLLISASHAAQHAGRQLDSQLTQRISPHPGATP